MISIDGKDREFNFTAKIKGGKEKKEMYSMLKPLDFILCTLCQGDDLLLEGVEKKKERREMA